MGLNLPGVEDVFQMSPEDGQVLKFRGGREIPEDDNDTTGSQIEFLVAADGSGDYTTIASALTALGANSGVIRIKAGTYNITSAINTSATNQQFIGSGWGVEVNTGTNDINAFVLDQSDCLIRNLKIVGSRTQGSNNYGVYITGNDCVVKGLRIEDVRTNGIYCVSANRTLIESCSIDDCAGYSIRLSNSPKTIVTNCHLTRSDTGGIYMTGAATYCLITNNIIADHQGDGIYMDDQDDCIIEGNILEGNGDAVTEDGIHLFDCVACIIIGNRIRGSSGYGISLDATATVADRINIVGNIILNNTTGQLDDNGTNTGNTGNIVA